MTQSNPSTATAKTEAKVADGSAPGKNATDDAINVSKVWFVKRIDLKGKAQAESVAATTTRDKVFNAEGKRDPRAAWTLEYLPRFRHFRVTWYPPKADDKPSVRLVHETQVAEWEPAA